MAETLSTVRTAVLRRLGDSTNVIWSNAEINRYIQEGYDRLLFSTQMLWKRAYSDDVDGTATYALPTDLQSVDRVMWNWRRIDAVTTRELIQADSAYRTTEGPVEAYSIEDDGVLTIRKYPVPSQTPTAGADTNNTRVEYFARGAALSVDGSTFEIPDRYVKYIRHFAMFRALERKGDGQDLELAQHWGQRFEQGQQRIRERMARVERTRIRVLSGDRGSGGPPPRPRLPVDFGTVVKFR